MQPNPSPSLYDRLGGVYNIATVIDDFTEMLCEAAGGPQRYSGRTMGDTHRHLGITEGEWAAFMEDLHQTLSRFQVPRPARTPQQVI